MSKSKKGTRRRSTAKVTDKKNTGAIPVEARHRMIAEAAFRRAMARGFTNGSPEQDWFEAEAEIDTFLSRPDERGSQRAPVVKPKMQVPTKRLD